MNIDEVNEFSDKMVEKGLFYVKKRDVHDAGENIYDKTEFGKWVADKGFTELVVEDSFTLDDMKKLRELFEKENDDKK